MNENVVKLLNEQLWYLGTYSDTVNVVPVGFKTVTPDGKLVVGAVMLEKTLENIKANGKICVSVCDGKEGYQIKGTATYVSEGEIVDKLNKIAEEKFAGKLKAKGAVIITPEKTLVTTGGPDNNKEI